MVFSRCIDVNSVTLLNGVGPIPSVHLCAVPPSSQKAILASTWPRHSKKSRYDSTRKMAKRCLKSNPLPYEILVEGCGETLLNGVHQVGFVNRGSRI